MRQAGIAEQKKPGADGKWLIVKEWSGTYNAEPARERFEPPAGVWRLTYKTEQGDGGRNGVVDIIVMSKTNHTLTAAYNLQGAASGVLSVKEIEPEYFLQVKSFGPRWRIAVERKE